MTFFFQSDRDKDKEKLNMLVHTIGESIEERIFGFVHDNNGSCYSSSTLLDVLEENKFKMEFNTNVIMACMLLYNLNDVDLSAVGTACGVTDDVFTKYLKEEMKEIINADKVSLIFVHWLIYFYETQPNMLNALLGW